MPKRFALHFHRWYDTLNEPWRVLLMLAIVLAFVIAPMQFPANSTPRAGIFVACFFGITRIWYLKRKRD